MLATLRFQVGLLSLMQALLLTNNVTLIAVNGLAGLQLADNKLLATLPVTGYVLGGAVWSMPAAAFMRRLGRRAGYTVGSLVAMLGAVLAWHAMTLGSLALLCAATFVCGLYNAFGASLRFAAADVADAYRPDFKARAISLVLTGGIAGGVIGPEISKWSREWLPAQFAGTYLTLVGFAFASLLLAQLLRLPAATKSDGGGIARPLAEILRQPACWVAIVCAALSYGVMNLLMVATPLAMQVCSHPYASAALVIEWHVIGMFAPGLVTGSLIGRFGVLPIIVVGCLLMLGCVAIALSGVELMHFVAALILLGVGWNFMYTGATALLTSAYRSAEKNKVQGFMDLCVFTTMITSSASSGALLFVNGWSILNLLSLPFVLLVLGAVIWLAGRNGWALGRTQPAVS
ncbi:MAG TPA: MFS transporter [Burkholderiaceae bacterium]|mgnify:CR=1 FL=1|jgi:MFS family permease|nr:MFS transporter [Burkholderiaceae bacterium]